MLEDKLIDLIEEYGFGSLIKALAEACKTKARIFSNNRNESARREWENKANCVSQIAI